MQPECSICNEVYNKTLRIPSVLPCGHSFCQRCIKDFKKQECPTCRVVYDKYTKNFAMISWIFDKQVTPNPVTYEAFYKICLVGQSGVGKTSIINTFANQEFIQNTSVTVGTGFKYITQCIQEKNYKFELWDTGGQQKYRSMAKLHYKNANLILVAFALNNLKSFEEIQRYWVKEISQLEPKSKVILIGNKCQCQQQIQQKTIEEYAIKSKLKYFKVSCKENRNIRKSWLQIVNLLIADKVGKVDSIIISAVQVPPLKKCRC